MTAKVSVVTVQPDKVVYSPGQTLNLRGGNPWLADDTAAAGDQPGRNLSIKADHIVEAANNDESFVDLSKAKVVYTSSNPSVASVSPAGVVKMKKRGVVTVTATVGGVGGSTPIVVS